MSSPATPKTVRTVCYSGRPPPPAQVVHQVRSSTGVTFGRQAHRLPLGWTGGNVWQSENRVASGGDAAVARKRGGR